VRVRRAPRTRPLIDALDHSLRSLFPKVSEDALWPVAFGHNDLNPDNLLKARDRKLWLLDWEISGVAPIASELGRVYLRAPSLQGPMLALLEAADPDGRGLSPRHQLALGASLALHRAVHIRKHRARWSRGLSENDARREVEGLINDARRAIVRLAA
jgi:aminoglycoside phosphotransferase (APT) family kinase protein